MGVPLLQTFLRNNPSNFTTYRLHSTKVVIDGPNISNTLYNEARILNQFNGEYLQYEALVERYLLKLRKCEVEPIFVFDGLHEPSKFHTCVSRLSENLQRVAAFQESCSFGGLPAESVERPDIKCLLIPAVFVAVLKRFNMKYVFVDFEADNAIAELAIKLKCPVMSRDSDFYIFTNYWEDCGNYCCIQPIPFDASPKAFGNGVCEACAARGMSQLNTQKCCYYLETTCFKHDRGAFSQLAAPLRPVFAVLWGNDYAPSGYFDPYLPRTVTNAVNAYGRFNKLEKMRNLISWLSNFGSNLQEAVNYVLSRVPPNKRAEAEDKFFKGLSLYAVDLDGTTARYGKYIGIDVTAASRPKPDSRNTSTSYDERARRVLRGHGDTGTYELTQNWPLALVDYYRTHPTFKLFDGIYSFGYLRGSDVEDVRRSESAYVCARLLRQLIYSVLFQLEGVDNFGHLRGLQGDSKNPRVREVLRNEHMRMTETTVYFLKLDLDSPEGLLQLHLGLPWKQDGLPNSLHALVCAAVVVLKADENKGQQAAERQSRVLSVASSPLVLATLAVSSAAFVLQKEQQQEPRTGEFLTDRILQQLNLLISDDPSTSSSTGLNFSFMHTYFQLQIAYATLVTLGAVLTTIMAPEAVDQEELGSLETASCCFPSGRLVHRLAVQLDRLAQSDRDKEICEVICPRLLGKTSMRTGSVQPLSQAVLSQVLSTFTKVIRSTDALLKGQH